MFYDYKESDSAYIPMTYDILLMKIKNKLKYNTYQKLNKLVNDNRTKNQ